jgi:hypothetical protein
MKNAEVMMHQLPYNAKDRALFVNVLNRSKEKTFPH